MPLLSCASKAWIFFLIKLFFDIENLAKFSTSFRKELVKFTLEEKLKTHYSSTISPNFFLLKIKIKITNPKTHTETSKIYKSLGIIGL